LPGRTGENNNKSQSGHKTRRTGKHKTDDEIIKKKRQENKILKQ
jgi:hypothetical protein